jgi:5-(carboxyamino)imidazole ribonucleotide mutase
MGSANDWPTVKKAADVLDALAIPHEVRVLSAHRTPAEVHEYAVGAADRGIQVLVGCAGMAAHLAGVLAALTNLPVIGVPLSGGIAQGLDALLSVAQMPSGFPVATVAVDGAANAGWLAARIIALTDAEVAKRLDEAREGERQRILDADGKLQSELEA